MKESLYGCKSESMAFGTLRQGRVLILASTEKVTLFSAHKHIDREHERTDKQDGERDHHEQV